MSPKNVRVLVICILSASTALPAASGIPDAFTNLKVLPDDIGRNELVSIMRGYAGALGVRCIHCHVGDDPDDLGTVDFVSDERETKRVARAMIAMTRKINDALLPATGREEFLEVGCRTCHRGLTRPQSLASLLHSSLAEGGADAVAQRYRGLRDEFYGRDAYDFGPQTLNGLAERAAREDRNLETALALVRLNLESHADDAYTHYLLGGILAANGERSAAIVSMTRALELDPGNAFFQRALDRLRTSEE